MLSAKMVFFASMCYSLPSIILYCLTMTVIFKYGSTFNSSFFVLYLYDSLMNLFTYTVGFYMMRLNSVTCEDCGFSFLYKNAADYFPMNFLTAMSYHMAYVQYSTTALISFNRMTVLWNYKFFEPLWKRFTWLIGFIVFALPFIDTHRCFYYKTDIQYNNETESYALVTPMPISDNFEYLIPAMVIITLISVGVNVHSLVTLRQLKSQKRNHVENNFIFITVITCFVQFLGCFLSVIRVMWANNPISGFLASILPFVSDSLTLVQPWLLFAFSTLMRKKMKEMIGIPSTKNGSVVIVRSVTN
ncbi:hypothetical protein B9Z55_019255 [Caenorhabditis nigoni]|uniref:Serpentine receptor class gamma n=1 Tax=Caenorhabditis nigoni TaxID=1611254 RepID=A0A2G5THS5_9PELO|nr:hypothetical protein B9Z55_019255 [Caenorhabditis nigoni]